MLANGEAVGNLAKVCKQLGAQFIHVSTDYVFNGEKQEGYDETDETGPINVYGESKLLGEKMAIANNAGSIIIRTSWVYSAFGKNFVKTMMKLMSERESISVVCDQTGRPTYAKNLAKLIFNLIEQKAPGGIYHYADEGAITWYDFALEIKNICNYSCNINPIPSSEYPVPAKRPRYSILNTQKISAIQGVVVPDWKEGLQDCINLLRKS
jgi:dTDP-4-dehydrorhamnose reductase